MTTRILLAGVLGGIAMFIWTTLAHVVLPLGQVGVHEIPNEPPVIVALHDSIGDGEGIYIFPGMGLGQNPSPEAKKDAMALMSTKLANGPSGFLVYHPRRPLNLARLLGTEFVTELIEAILVVFLLAQTRLASFGARLGFVTVAGILAAIATNVSYWNWYGFSKHYTAAYILTEVVGFFIVGLVSALLFRNRHFVPQRAGGGTTLPGAITA